MLMKGLIQNNIAVLCGVIVSEPMLHHTVMDKNFYMTQLQIRRESGIYDVLPLIIAEETTDINELKIGECVKIIGHYRSYNKYVEGRKKSYLILSVYARTIQKSDNLLDNTNEIYMDGYFCKQPIFRETPLGRQIADGLLAVNRAYGKTDYIPCIFWGENAWKISEYQTGERCIVKGRIQSREYQKKTSDNTSETRTAYEVSVTDILTPADCQKYTSMLL